MRQTPTTKLQSLATPKPAPEPGTQGPRTKPAPTPQRLSAPRTPTPARPPNPSSKDRPIGHPARPPPAPRQQKTEPLIPPLRPKTRQPNAAQSPPEQCSQTSPVPPRNLRRRTKPNPKMPKQQPMPLPQHKPPPAHPFSHLHSVKDSAETASAGPASIASTPTWCDARAGVIALRRGAVKPLYDEFLASLTTSPRAT